MTFPENFRWGASTSSYQIEGAAEEDGKGLSIWDVFCRRKGKIQDGSNGTIACDHYHRYREDVELMHSLNLGAYRFSLSWPRILPEGQGQVNHKGLDFYDHLVDELLKYDIEPWITLFHWDYPHALYLRGGWLNRDSADWFADYTKTVVDRLSDRVHHWLTLNEPQVFIGMGHQQGVHAPGLKLGIKEVLLAAHHAMLAHGKAVQIIRSRAKSESRVGLAPVGVVTFPDSTNAEDIDAACQCMFSIRKRDVWNNTWFADPMLLGQYPQDGINLFGADLPNWPDRDLDTIHQPLDFYGVNFYFGLKVHADKRGRCKNALPSAGESHTRMDWPITPEALYWGIRFLYERYRLPIVVTENGISNMDWIHADGEVHDPQRIDYVGRHLAQIYKSLQEGIPVLGYFTWSFLDNFEWERGYTQRFGLVYVDYVTQRRIPKDSATWYKKVIETKGAHLTHFRSEL